MAKVNTRAKQNNEPTSKSSASFHAIAGVPEIPLPALQLTRIQPYKWEPFGLDNLFPQQIAQLTRKSPAHRGIINWKTIYCSAKGFAFDEKNKELEKFLKAANAKSESLKTIVKKCFFDRFSGGNSYIEIVKDPKNLICNLYHKDHTTCRVSADGKSVLIYANWTFVNRTQPENIKSIPLYPEFQMIDGYMRSIYHYKSYEPEFSTYGIPDWIAAMDAAGIAYKTNKWNISRLENSFASSGTIVVEGNFSAKEARQLKRDFKAEMTGEGKQGKIMLVVKSLGGGNTTFTPITQTSEGDWLQLHKQSDDDLLKSHNWFRSLCGMESNGFNYDQARKEYSVAMNTVIAEEQESMLEVFKKIISENTKLDLSVFSFKNESPFALRDLLEPRLVLTVDEQRAVFNYPELASGKGKELLNISPKGAQPNSQ